MISERLYEFTDHVIRWAKDFEETNFEELKPDRQTLVLLHDSLHRAADSLGSLLAEINKGEPWTKYEVFKLMWFCNFPIKEQVPLIGRSYEAIKKKRREHMFPTWHRRTKSIIGDAYEGIRRKRKERTDEI